MKQVVYTCARCGRQDTVNPNPGAVPMEWATIQYERIHMVQEDGKELKVLTTSETHACGNCAKGVLDYIEQPAHLGANEEGCEALANLTGDLLRANGKIFENTLHTLSRQITSLHAQVTTLTAQNAILSRDLDDARDNARLEP